MVFGPAANSAFKTSIASSSSSASSSASSSPSSSSSSSHSSSPPSSTKYYYVHVKQTDNKQPVATGIIRGNAELPDGSFNSIEIPYRDAVNSYLDAVGEYMMLCAAKVTLSNNIYKIDRAQSVNNSIYKSTTEFNACIAEAEAEVAAAEAAAKAAEAEAAEEAAAAKLEKQKLVKQVKQVKQAKPVGGTRFRKTRSKQNKRNRRKSRRQ